VSEQWDEWRVTGDPGGEFGAYSFIWSKARGDEQPEVPARLLMRRLEDQDEPWKDGPHLHRRTVTVTDWIPAPDAERGRA